MMDVCYSRERTGFSANSTSAVFEAFGEASAMLFWFFVFLTFSTKNVTRFFCVSSPSVRL